MHYRGAYLCNAYIHEITCVHKYKAQRNNKWWDCQVAFAGVMWDTCTVRAICSKEEERQRRVCPRSRRKYALLMYKCLSRTNPLKLGKIGLLPVVK